MPETTTDQGLWERIRELEADLSRCLEEKKALETDEALFRLIDMNTDDAVFLIQEGTILFANPSGTRMLGTDPVGQPLDAYVHPEDRSILDMWLRHREREDGRPAPESFRIRSGRGGRWMAMRTAPVYWRGKPATLFFMTDITDRKQTETDMAAQLDHLERTVQRRSSEIREIHGHLQEAEKEQKRITEALRQTSEKYQCVLKGIEEGYFEMDAGGYITTSNAAMCDIAGYPPGQLNGLHHRECTSPDTARRMSRIANQVFQSGRPEKVSGYEIIRKDGTHRRMELSLDLKRNRRGRPKGFIGIARDVTDREKAADELRRIRRQYRLIADHTSEVIETLSLETQFTFSSPSVSGLRGWTAEETLDQTLSDVLIPESLKTATQIIAEELTREAGETADPRRSRTLELTMRHKDGTPLSTEVTFRFLRDATGRPVEILWVVRDISERKTTQEELTYLVHHDSLTGLFNRKAFLERLRESVAYATRYNMERAIFYIDLNGFKSIHEQWGHETGDRLLKEAATRLRRSLRSTDIISRLEGDRFTVILNNPVDLYPELAASNLIKSLSLPYDILDSQPIDSISPRIGVSLFPWDGRDVETLIRKADTAMRRARRPRKEGENERGSVFFYEETLAHTDGSSGRGIR